jgi:hypothetical protein
MNQKHISPGAGMSNDPVGAMSAEELPGLLAIWRKSRVSRALHELIVEH